MLDKSFDHQRLEAALYKQCEDHGYFKAGRSNGAPYTIMLPPPNVTGSLHIGHALSYTLQDILIRFERMRGRDALWQCGTDHAGIATQMMVEKQLASQGLTRQQLGRDAFIDKVWEWKAASGGTITKQLRRLGASMDWARERFTMDEGLSKAVRHAFVKLYNDGLIYRDKRLVNWDCTLQTAVSDLEVIPTETKGAYYHIAYPLADGSGSITVATTRPETLFGDQAVAVHPEDERYQSILGKQVRLPLTERTIPIIADTYSDPEKGTGAVKITPAHDFNDFDVGRRHGLQQLNILEKDGTLNEHAGTFAGQDRLKARAKVVEALEAQALLVKIEPVQHTVPHGDRSGTVIEPYLTEQWYCRADVLAKPALQAVRDGRTRFVPQQWENTYFHWLETIQPWCISRQLWWGHQIPAWYDADGRVYVAETLEAAQAQAGKNAVLRQDDDVLDTWFSSGLWPFSTLGWPEHTPDLARYYPTNVLVTGFDIIFFWVARMMMFGLYFTGDVPFKDIYIHGLVRDAKGQKMSKTKGNVIDPLTLCDEYGTDAVRFTMAEVVVQGRDARLAPERVALSRNFITKLWNAARFCEMNGCALPAGYTPETVQHPFNQWILAKLNSTIAELTLALQEYRFNEAAKAIHGFIWDTFCDWYVEFSKPILTGNDEQAKAETQATAAYVLQQTLTLLHPFAPFVTDTLAQALGLAKQSLCVATWPTAQSSATNTSVVDTLQQLISGLRRERGLLNISNAVKYPVYVSGTNVAWFEPYHEQILRMANIEKLVNTIPSNALALPPMAGLQLAIDSHLVDKAERRAHYQQEIIKAQKDSDFFANKLNNPNFVSRADPDIVAEHREKLAQAEAAKAFCAEQLQRFMET